ncbi:MAG: FAD:protein FMN transferase [Bacteroidetes bacterium]|nr:FAD:protein FMN transferase [Bacteroidota bacterium]
MLCKSKVRIRLMGSEFELVATAADESATSVFLEQGINEIKRLETLLTEFSNTSQTAIINNNAGITEVQVDAEVYELIKRCKNISALTQGAFDISAGTLKRLYNFKNAAFKMPDRKTVLQTLKSVGYKKIELRDNNKVYLQAEGMRIGFGAIGKGYAADKVKALWQAAGMTSGVINASGDLTVWGDQPDGSPWKVGIADPDNKDNILLWLPVSNASVATSGNYEQYFDLDGIRYSHNIDPGTGQPARFIKSVTIVSQSAELSDALATAVTIMGKEVGLDFINQLPNVHCIIIDADNKISYSKNIKINA